MSQAYDCLIQAKERGGSCHRLESRIPGVDFFSIGIITVTFIVLEFVELVEHSRDEGIYKSFVCLFVFKMGGEGLSPELTQKAVCNCD